MCPLCCTLGISVAKMNSSLLAGMSGWWGVSTWQPPLCCEGNASCQADLQGQQGAWALLLWVGCLTVLWHCKGRRNDVLEHQKLIPPVTLALCCLLFGSVKVTVYLQGCAHPWGSLPHLGPGSSSRTQPRVSLLAMAGTAPQCSSFCSTLLPFPPPLPKANLPLLEHKALPGHHKSLQSPQTRGCFMVLLYSTSQCWAMHSWRSSERSVAAN